MPFDDDPIFFTARVRQGVLLERQVLLMRGDPGVADVHGIPIQVLNNPLGSKYFLTLFSAPCLLPKLGGGEQWNREPV
jgi:hypothetical protein